MNGLDARADRLRALYAVLSAPDPSPAADAGDQDWAVWMDRVGPDGDLAGLVYSAAHGRRYTPQELADYRDASERFGSRLDPETLAEVYRLLTER